MSEPQQVINDLLARIEALEAKVFPVYESSDGGPNASIMYSNGSPVLDQSPPKRVLKAD